MKNIIEKIFGKDKSLYSKIIFAVGIIGILLIFISSVLPMKSKNTKDKGDEYISESEYISVTEAKLTEMLAKMHGVGSVKVMITLESDGDYIYAQNERSDNEKQDANNENQSEKHSYESEHIILDNGNDKKALVETHLAPEVKGVAVICTGGGDITVISKVTEMISALLNVSTNRICVTKMI
ncbi:MAG: hypothetical protein RR573_07810 [Oscillospiraceae bacterium]